jgi:hypothetical protein
MSSAIRLRPIAVIASLLVASLTSTRALADGWHTFAREAVSTTAELGGALVGSTALLASTQVTASLGAEPVAYTCEALAPAGAAAGASLVGRWLDRGGSYWWSALDAYAGTGVGILAGAAIDERFPAYDDYTPILRVMASMYVGGNLGAVLGYKLSRRSPKPHEVGLRLDPPSLALSLKSAKPGASPQIAGVRLNLLDVRF